MLNFCVKHPVAVLLLFLGATTFFGWQAQKFEINASADTLIADDNRHFLESQQVSQRFAPEEFLLVVYKPTGHPLFGAKSFRDIQAIADELQTLDRVSAVRTILNVPLLSKMEGLSGGIDPDKFTQAALQLSPEELSDIFHDHPVYEGLIVDKSQSAAAIQLLFKPDKKLQALEGRITELKMQRLDDELSDNQQAELERLESQAEPLLKELRETRNSEVETVIESIKPFEREAEVYLGGVQVLGYELIKIIKNDLVVFGAAIGITVCLVLLLLFHSLRWVLIPALCCFCSVVITVGLFGLLALKATVISSSFIALQLILTLAIVIHLIVQYREDLRDNPDMEQRELILLSLRRKVAPCFYAGLTTSVGFGSLLLSGIEPVIAFGWMMVVAMLVSIACSLLLLPAAHSLFKRERVQERNSIFRWLINSCQRSAQHHGRALILGSLVLSAAAISGLFLLNVENSFINYFDKDTRIHRELSYVDQEFGGSTPLDIVYNIPPSQQAKSPTLSANTVQTLQKIQHRLEQHKGVGTTLSVVNFTELAKQINDGKPLTEYELTALYWSLDKSVRKDLVGSFFDPDSQQLRISTRIKDSTEGLNRKALKAGIENDFRELGIAAEDIQLSNLFILYQDMLERLFSSQILTLTVVFVVLCIMFGIIFRSLRIALIAILPNILSALTVLGSMGWLGVPLDFMTITIAAIAIGIAVDDTIHYIHRYQAELNQDDPLARTHHAVGYALLYTSIIVICGFSLLAFSDFTPSVMFGIFTSLAMAIAMLSNLTLLPALLDRYVKQH